MNSPSSHQKSGTPGAGANDGNAVGNRPITIADIKMEEDEDDTHTEILHRGGGDQTESVIQPAPPVFESFIQDNQVAGPSRPHVIEIGGGALRGPFFKPLSRHEWIHGFDDLESEEGSLSDLVGLELLEGEGCGLHKSMKPIDSEEKDEVAEEEPKSQSVAVAGPSKAAESGTGQEQQPEQDFKEKVKSKLKNAMGRWRVHKGNAGQEMTRGDSVSVRSEPRRMEYPCRYCSETFGEAKDLVKHMSVHSGECPSSSGGNQGNRPFMNEEAILEWARKGQEAVKKDRKYGKAGDPDLELKKLREEYGLLFGKLKIPDIRLTRLEEPAMTQGQPAGRRPVGKH